MLLHLWKWSASKSLLQVFQNAALGTETRRLSNEKTEDGWRAGKHAAAVAERSLLEGVRLICVSSHESLSLVDRSLLSSNTQHLFPFH